jgi:hypothetical protein
MEYIIISGGIERAELISTLLFDIVKHPSSVGTSMLFGTVTHPQDGRVALKCKMDYPMPLQNAAPLAALVDELSDTVGVEEAAQWAASMVGSTVTFADLLPEGVVVYGHEAMEADGWFVTDEIEA